MAGSWLLFHRYWLTTLVAVPVLAWMGLFLLVWPKAMVESGLIDELARQKADQER